MVPTISDLSHSLSLTSWATSLKLPLRRYYPFFFISTLFLAQATSATHAQPQHKSNISHSVTPQQAVVAKVTGKDNIRKKTTLPTATKPNSNSVLPPTFAKALAKAKIPQDAVSVFVQAVDNRTTPRLAYRENVLVKPASVMKAITTFSALDQLGPAYTWKTYIYTEGNLQNGTLNGNLYIKGTGDPKLTMERLWFMLRQVQQRGIQSVTGDIILDRSAYNLSKHDASAFDGEPLRPYNASADALLINFKTILLRFIPEPNNKFARILVSPPIENLTIPRRIPLTNVGSNGKNLHNCPADWHNRLKIDVSQADQWHFNGHYPATCDDSNWNIAYPFPDIYASKSIEGMWRELGGSLTGKVHAGVVPEGLPILTIEESAPLAEIVRDVNKYSNNVMADQVFLALPNPDQQLKQKASFEQSRQQLSQWWTHNIGNPENSIIIDNGSGLSRQTRITTSALGKMLQYAWRSSVMPEFIASLPLAGVDGTLESSTVRASAHLKTGSLQDVNAIAGYVDGKSGRRYVLVAIINHPNAAAAYAGALNTIIEWVAND